MEAKEVRLGQRIRRLTASRDVWKHRSLEKQAMIRYLRVKVRDLEVSREFWKSRATIAANTSCPANPLEPKRPMDEMPAGE